MVNANTYLLIFAVAFMGCVLATPLVTRLATWLGAIDLPDQFRRIHKGATPRMGGLGLAFSLVVAVAVVAVGGYLREWPDYPRWLVPIGLASAIVLVVGVADDNRELAPRLKLLGQASAVLVLYLGGVRIDGITVTHWTIPLDRPALELAGVSIALPGLAVTMLWFLACMNIWNLIDGMDGLASGVGLLVAGTLALVAVWLENPYVAILAAALAGGLAGFLLYNWHPACIFLGDSGSLLIGLLIGVAGVQGSLKEGATIPILFPILAMGLPISDTAMAIFRRWVRNLPLSSADRRHVHHLLIGLGLTTRQAACMLYCFSAGLCGVVLLGVVFGNEILALMMGLGGCLAFLLVLTSRRDELSTLRADLASRMTRGRQERFAAKVTWEAIQRVELCEAVEGIWDIVRGATAKLGCEHLRLSCRLGDGSIFERDAWCLDPTASDVEVSGPSATFRLSSGRDLLLIVSLRQVGESPLAADIAFRFVQRLSLASAERLERLFSATTDSEPVSAPTPVLDSDSDSETIPALGSPSKAATGWFRAALGWTSAPAVPARSLGEE
jgi:UDP-GlcNAc:undecaprenyl-phosphate GlcNAc-1-phosphate transferase